MLVGLFFATPSGGNALSTSVRIEVERIICQMPYAKCKLSVSQANFRLPFGSDFDDLFGGRPMRNCDFDSCDPLGLYNIKG